MKKDNFEHIPIGLFQRRIEQTVYTERSGRSGEEFFYIVTVVFVIKMEKVSLDRVRVYFY